MCTDQRGRVGSLGVAPNAQLTGNAVRAGDDFHPNAEGSRPTGERFPPFAFVGDGPFATPSTAGSVGGHTRLP